MTGLNSLTPDEITIVIIVVSALTGCACAIGTLLGFTVAVVQILRRIEDYLSQSRKNPPLL